MEVVSEQRMNPKHMCKEFVLFQFAVHSDPPRPTTTARYLFWQRDFSLHLSARRLLEQVLELFSDRYAASPLLLS